MFHRSEKKNKSENSFKCAYLEETLGIGGNMTETVELNKQPEKPIQEMKKKKEK